MRKKHSKCLLAALMALMMLLSLAGCGGNTTATDTDSKDPTVQTDNAESKNTTDTKTDSAAQKDAAKDGETADSAKTDDTKKDAVSKPDTAENDESGKEPAKQDDAKPDSGKKNDTQTDTAKGNDAKADTGKKNESKSDTGSTSGNTTSGSSSSSGSSGSGSGSGSSTAPSQPSTPAKKELSCTISITCDTILNNMDLCDASKQAYVPSDGVILSTTTVTFTEGESVFDVLQRVCRSNGISMSSSWSSAFGSAYVEGIAQLFEKDVGGQSGWMYCVNGSFPNYGCSSYVLEDGDSIDWVYTCENGGDV